MSSSVRQVRGRVVFDLTTSLRWKGPPRGIERVERHLARWAHAHLPDVTFVVFDKQARNYREVRRDLTALLFADRPVDETRLQTDAGDGPSFVPGAGDTVISAGVGWLNGDIAAIADLKARIGFRFVLLCYDLTPLKFPGLGSPEGLALFRHYMLAAFAICDRVIVSSEAVAGHVHEVCSAAGLAAPDLRLTPFGFDFSATPPDVAAALPQGLESGRYGLFVSQVLLRKGHWMLGAVWRRLLAEGVPQRAGFKLAFVGVHYAGVMRLVEQLREPADMGRYLLLLDKVDDAQLATLYREAAFCLYPSLYEGYGLPIVEAFAYGKAVLASTGGAVPELASGFSPCLDPTDGKVWLDTLRSWIEDPSLRVPYEIAIRERFKHPNWAEASAQFFAAAMGA